MKMIIKGLGLFVLLNKQKHLFWMANS